MAASLKVQVEWRPHCRRARLRGTLLLAIDRPVLGLSFEYCTRLLGYHLRLGRVICPLCVGGAASSSSSSSCSCSSSAPGSSSAQVPFCARSVLAIDAAQRSAFTFGVSPGRGGLPQWSDGVAVGSTVFGVPFGAVQCLAIGTSTGYS